MDGVSFDAGRDRRTRRFIAGLTRTYAHQARDQILARHHADQVSFLIDNRGQTESRGSQTPDRARRGLVFLNSNHSAKVTAESMGLFFIEQNIEDVNQTEGITV